ncbi:MAG: D-glycero-alpha-D-manno-heptose 7-phosphate kinase [Gemmatimonadaceae bacterium]|nr:D-glycero-alpha-D-manno-heptose 7-phosphate kinase [Gemmatimonadaceae bacterium]
MTDPSTPYSLVARAPTRLDFGGGWTDVPPYSTREGGCVCNVAITLCAHVRLTRIDFDQATRIEGPATDQALVDAALQRMGVSGVRLELSSDFPVSAGLGGSSAAGVAILGALDRWNAGDSALNRTALAEMSRNLEVRDLGIAGGRQDHYAAAYGGALGLWFAENTTVRPIPLPPDLAQTLARRCVVAYTGESRISADTILGVMNAYESGSKAVTQALAHMKGLAELMILALQHGDIDTLGRLVANHWQWQRSLHPAIPTPLIDDLLARATYAGSLGGKALGASGGGCVLAIAPQGGEQRLRAAMSAQAQLLDFMIDTNGFSWEAIPA